MRINRLSKGWLGFLGVGGGGQLLDEIGNTVQPVLDALPFLGADTLRVFKTDATAVAGTEAALTQMRVPAGVVWLVRRAGALVNLNPGDQAQPRLTLADISLSASSSSGGFPLTGSGNYRFGLPPMQLNSMAAGVYHGPVEYEFSPPLVMLSGQGFNYGFLRGTLANDTVYELQVLCHELPLP